MSTGDQHGPQDASAQATSAETMRVRGEALADKVKELLHEGNVRRVIVRNDQGHTIIEIPVTAGVIAAALAPTLVAVAALAALASSWDIEIERISTRIPTTGRSDGTRT